jgi:hypothetical protein
MQRRDCDQFVVLEPTSRDMKVSAAENRQHKSCVQLMVKGGYIEVGFE